MARYRKKTYWKNMSEEERLEEMRQIAKEECVVDGEVFFSKSYRLYKAMEEYGVSADDLIKGTGLKKGVAISAKWKDMSEEDRLKEMRRIVKEECMADGVALLSRSDKLKHAMKTYKISADKLLEGTGLKRRLGHEEFKNKLLKEIKHLDKTDTHLNEKILDRLTNANTFGELIATTIYSKGGNVKEEALKIFSVRQKATYITNRLSGLLAFSDEPINKLTREKYEDILRTLTANSSIPASSEVIINRKIGELLFKNAAETGLFIPAGLEYANGSYVSKFIKAERKRIKRATTVYEHCIRVFPDGELHMKARVLIALKETASVEPEHYGLVLTRESLRSESKAIRSIIVREISKMLDSLQSDGIIFGVPQYDSIRGSAIELPYIQNLLTKDNTAKEDRTFGWYVFDTMSLQELLEKKHLKQNAYNAYKEYFGIKLAEMTKEDFLKIRSKPNAPRLMDIVRKIHAEGIYPKDILIILKEREDDALDLNATTWKTSGGFLDFSAIDEIYREAIRYYVKYFEENKKHVAPWKIYKMLEFFKLSNMPELSTLARDSEMIFYTVLKKSIINDKSQRMARSVLKQFRSIVSSLDKIDKKLVPKNYKINYDFIIKAPKSKITTFNKDEQQAIVEFLQKPSVETDKYLTRLQLCAFGIQILSARRIGEVVSKKKDCGLKVDAIRDWGMSGERELRYFRQKSPSGNKVVLFSDMIGERTDPFAKAIPWLIPKLFEEAKEITSAYRHLLPANIREYLFVAKTRGAGTHTLLYKKMGESFVFGRVKKLFKAMGIDAKKSSHTSRHTMATSLILSGGTVADAADALGDKTHTVSKYYHEYTSRQDTIRLFADRGRTQMVDSLEDSAQFKKIEEGKHKVLSPEDMSPHGHKMAGGSCTHTVEGRLNCKSYQMIRGAKSCPGCEFFEISIVDNKAYWEAELRASLQNIEATDASSPAFLYEDLNCKVAKNMIKEIEEKELEKEWGLQ